jgi:hypothetical protein
MLRTTCAFISLIAFLSALPAGAFERVPVPAAAKDLAQTDSAGATAIVEPLLVECRRNAQRDECLDLMLFRGQLLIASDMVEGIRSFEEALTVSDRVLGPTSSTSADALTGLAILLAQAFSLKRAREVYERLIPLAEARHSPSHPGVLFLTSAYATVLGGLDRSKAIQVVDDLIPRVRTAGLAEMLISNMLLKAMLFEETDGERAIALKREIMREPAFGTVPPQLHIRVLVSLASSLDLTMAVEEALALSRQAEALAGTSAPLQEAARPALALIAKYTGTTPKTPTPAQQCRDKQAQLGERAAQTIMTCVDAAAQPASLFAVDPSEQGLRLIERYYPIAASQAKGELLHGFAALVYGFQLQLDRRFTEANARYAEGFAMLSSTRVGEVRAWDAYKAMYAASLLEANQNSMARKIALEASSGAIERSRRAKGFDAQARQLLKGFAPAFGMVVKANWRLAQSGGPS